MKIGMIVLDTLRYDVFCSKMSEITEQADYNFENMYSTSRWTVPAHGSLFTGKYPTEVGTHSKNKYLNTSETTIAEILSSEGFKTIGLSNNTYVDSFFEFDRGFDIFHRGPVLERRPTTSSGFDWSDTFNQLPSGLLKYPIAVKQVLQSDTPTLQTLSEGFRFALTSKSLSKTNTIEWVYESLDNISLDSDLFLFANMMTCHSPYRPPSMDAGNQDSPPEPFELCFRDVTEKEADMQRNAYGSCAEYLDKALQPLIEGIEWDLLFILSDHGELLGEHGLWQHQYGMYEELVRVPAVAFGDLGPDGATDELTSLLDVHKTILDVANVGNRGRSRGINLFNSGKSRDFVYAESVGNYRYSPDAQGLDANIPESWGEAHYTYIRDGLKYINDKDGERMVDLNMGGDSDLGIDHLRSSVDKLRDEFKESNYRAPDKEIPAEIEDRLEYLGYK